jgi:hypothetical protein
MPPDVFVGMFFAFSLFAYLTSLVILFVMIGSHAQESHKLLLQDRKLTKIIGEFLE